MLFKVGFLQFCDPSAHFERLYQGFFFPIRPAEFYGSSARIRRNVFVHNEVYCGSPRLSNTLMLANLKRRVLIYYSSIILSSHAKLCPVAECDVMSSCNDVPTCEWRQTSIKKEEKTFRCRAFCSVKEMSSTILSNG